MARLRLGIPLWLDLTPDSQRSRYRSLKGNTTVDVVIVGGGLTGAALAWKFSTANIRVALLERDRVGHGSTAANSALLMHEPDTDLGDLAALYGHAAARRIWQLSREATRDFIGTLQQFEIACDVVERRSVYYTLESERVRHLRAEHHRRRAAGFGGQWLDAVALQRVTGINGVAGIQTRGNAQLDPYRACMGLIRAAEINGASIFEYSAVHRIKTVQGHVEAVTRGGRVFADYAVIATGYATPEFKTLAGRFAMKHTYVLVTERISSRTRAALGLDEVLLWDTERPYHYARWTKDHRLLLGGEDQPQVPERRRAPLFTQSQHALRGHFDRLFPPLREVPTAYAWEGLFAMTPDGLPYIGPHRRYPRHLFALGYGGNGMTFGFLAARLLVDWFLGNESPDQRLFVFGRHR
jgi:glycine/D-amino acid oxidase-like deaminating enzyme